MSDIVVERHYRCIHWPYFLCCEKCMSDIAEPKAESVVNWLKVNIIDFFLWHDLLSQILHIAVLVACCSCGQWFWWSNYGMGHFVLNLISLWFFTMGHFLLFQYKLSANQWDIPKNNGTMSQGPPPSKSLCGYLFATSISIVCMY